MGMENSADSRLWGAVNKAYEERNYTAVILDSIQYLGDVIREKTGLSNDGMALVGEAFGGAKPKLRVNRFETDTDKNIQSGIEHLVRGLYKAFRNPRSHEKHVDSQDDADTVLLMVTYLLKVIGQAKSPFERASFLKRVFDPAFVQTGHYANLLAGEIPAKHQFDVLVEIFRERGNSANDGLSFMTTAIWKKLSDEAKNEFALIVSDELNTISKDELTSVIKTVPREIWVRCSEAARLRTEHQLIQSIESGRYDDSKKRCVAGALGTWIGRLSPLLSYDSLETTIASLLESRSDEAIAYVRTYLWSFFYSSVAEPSFYLQNVLINGLIDGDIRFKQMTTFINSKKIDFETMTPLDEDQYPRWRELLIEKFEQFEAAPLDEDGEQDDIPF